MQVSLNLQRQGFRIEEKEVRDRVQWGSAGFRVKTEMKSIKYNIQNEELITYRAFLYTTEGDYENKSYLCCCTQ